MSTEKNSALVATFTSHHEAEAAIKELQKSDFDVTKLSIVGKNFHPEEDVVGFYNTGNRMKTWGKYGAFWGSLWGFLVGSAFFIIPGIGPIVVAGPLAAWIVGAIEGAAVGGGFGLLGGALASVGIPKDSVIRYEQALKADKFVLIAHGTAEEVERARGIISNACADDTTVDTHLA